VQRRHAAKDLEKPPCSISQSRRHNDGVVFEVDYFKYTLFRTNPARHVRTTAAHLESITNPSDDPDETSPAALENPLANFLLPGIQ